MAIGSRVNDARLLYSPMHAHIIFLMFICKVCIFYMAYTVLVDLEIWNNCSFGLVPVCFWKAVVGSSLYHSIVPHKTSILKSGM